MRLRRVVERGNERMLLQYVLHDAALHTLATAMNEPYFAQPRLERGVHVFLDDGWNVFREEGVKVERGFDGDAMHEMIVSHSAFRCSLPDGPRRGQRTADRDYVF